MSDSVRSHRQQPTRLPRPWDSPDKNTGVGYHFLLQCMKVKRESEVTQSCPTLHDPMDCIPPGSSVHGTFRARELEWVVVAFPYHSLLLVNITLKVKVAQSCPTLCDPMNCSLPGFSIHGIFQARVLAWDAITFSDLTYNWGEMT